MFGSLNLTTVELSGVGSSFQKHADAESKGIKAHFNMDESGVLLLDRVSYTFQISHRTVNHFSSVIGSDLHCVAVWSSVLAAMVVIETY